MIKALHSFRNEFQGRLRYKNCVAEEVAVVLMKLKLTCFSLKKSNISVSLFCKTETTWYSYFTRVTDVCHEALRLTSQELRDVCHKQA